MTRPTISISHGAGTATAALAALPESLKLQWRVPPGPGRAGAAAASGPVALDPQRDGLLLCTDIPPAGGTDHPALAVPARGLPEGLTEACARRGQGLWVHHFRTLALAAYAAGSLGEPLTVMLPGQVLRIGGRGVLLTGPAGCGKSAASLGLIDRGHRLVADDAFLCAYRPQAGWHAEPAEAGRGLLAVRGMGLLDIRSLRGAEALAPAATVELEIRLTPEQRLDAGGTTPERLTGPTLPGVDRLTLPATPGRDLPLLIETAMRDHSRYTGCLRSRRRCGLRGSA